MVIRLRILPYLFRNLCLVAGFLLLHTGVKAQTGRWQQRIRYVMDVKLNPADHRITGTQQISYSNNSPDSLKRLFIHLYWNAFQPGSMMDVRSRELGKTVLATRSNGEKILDWDGRVRDRISALSPEQQGIQQVEEIRVNGRIQKTINHETILEVVLDQPLLPGSTTTINTRFTAQVPEQIRRSGRNSAEGVQYSMSQWYPKVAEYDAQGWHPNFYVAREFYGVWGDFQVNITLPREYLVAATGQLSNAGQIGYGYEAEGVKVQAPVTSSLTWKFKASNVHDFVWAADTQYKLIRRKSPGGPMIYVVYKQKENNDAVWMQLLDSVSRYFPYMAKTFGAYPYPVYSFIQGGDGGMEYPMATLIRNASLGTAVHEWMHSWYQMMLGTNESLYPWMDEGFTSYAESRTLGYMRGQTFSSWFADDFAAYIRLAKSGFEEPMSTHADHFTTNYAYSSAAYGKGAVFLAQLGYICGQEKLDKILQEYYRQWSFRHPTPNDFIRVAEEVSGMELDWYKEYMLYTTKSIDYAVGNTEQAGTADSAVIRLKRLGQMPMPVDVQITLKDGTKRLFSVPLNLMFGAKSVRDRNEMYSIAPEWKWTHPEYELKVNVPVASIKEIMIDPQGQMADMNRTNNRLMVP